MLVLILSTLLISTIVLVLTSIFFLISMVIEYSDDGAVDALILDNDQFSSNPGLSCLPDSQQNHTEECREAQANRLILEQELNQEHLSQVDKVDETEARSVLTDDKRDCVSSQEAQDEIWSGSVAKQKSLMANRLGPVVSKQIFDDFDQRDMQLGGTGLHWCKSRRSFDRLIKLGVPLNGANVDGDTALHVAIRRRRLQLVIGLLCQGADLEKANKAGETPLMVAIRVNDIFSCQLLLVFDADVNVSIDKSGSSPRHCAANICEKQLNQQQSQSQVQSQQPNAAHLILAMLHAMGAKRCSDKKLRCKSTGLTSVTSCPDGCSNLGTYNGNSYNRWPEFEKESLYKRHMFTDLIKNSASILDQPKRSRLLCIDGGGLRGVIVCQILIELQKYLKRPLLSYFDWIGGTSVGAFLGCALSNGTSIHQLRRISFDVKDEVFSGTKPYNSKFLERVLKRTYGSARLSDIKGKKLAVTTVLADRDPCQLKFFRNYKSPVELLEKHGFSADEFDSMSGHSAVRRRESIVSLQSNDGNEGKSAGRSRIKQEAKTDFAIDENEHDPFIWQAVRASAAAPFFFKPYGPFLDGGIISNNPTLDMLTEFFSYESVKKFLRSRVASRVNVHAPDHDPDLREPSSRLDLVVSLGTGRGRVIGRQNVIDFGHVASGFSTVFSPVELLKSIRGARDLFKKLMQQSCHTDDHILDRAQAWCYSLDIPYFRINPPLATIFSIDDKRDEQLIFALWQTKLYMLSMKEQLLELGCILDGRGRV